MNIFMLGQHKLKNTFILLSFFLVHYCQMSCGSNPLYLPPIHQPWSSPDGSKLILMLMFGPPMFHISRVAHAWIDKTTLHILFELKKRLVTSLSLVHFPLVLTISILKAMLSTSSPHLELLFLNGSFPPSSHQYGC